MGVSPDLSEEIPGDRAPELHELFWMPYSVVTHFCNRSRSRARPRILSPTEKPLERSHAMLAVASFRMNGWIIEKDAIASRRQLLSHHEFLIHPPIRVVHACR